MHHLNDSNEPDSVPDSDLNAPDGEDDDSEGGKGELDRPGYTISELDASSLEPLSTEVIDVQDNPNDEVSPSSPNRTIRFRSRVRITSGLHKHHRHRPDTPPSNSHSQSLSSSPSSSISVPIRFRDDESPSASSKWGPLGQRVRLLVSRQKQQQQQQGPGHGQKQRQTRKKMVIVCASNARTADETTPLLDGQNRAIRARSLYVQHQASTDDRSRWESDSQYQARLNHEIDVMFGKWPARLLNRHWWWWQLEPILCCRYAEDSDSDF